LGPIADNLLRDPAEAYLSDLCFMKPAAVRRLLGTAALADVTGNAAFERVMSTYRRCPSNDALQRAQYADLKIYMPNGPLVKVDRMSMLHSLEVRCPLLDRRVVEFAFRLPASRKMPRLRGKHLLRQLAARRLPAAISRLPKRGFTAPVGRWLAGAGAEHFVDEAFGPSSTCGSVLDVEVVKQLYSEHRRHAADHSYSLWAVWMFERWARTCRRAAACHV
jgi:asparagine synthase (glutamine-hydrolysing)